MSDDLIRRSDAIEALRKLGHEVVVIDKVCSLGVAVEFIDAIRTIPSADRPQGKWIAKTENYHSHWVCSECGAWALLDFNEQMFLSNFCPDCGARMKGADDE